MAKLSPENALWVLVQMSRSTFYGSHVIEALQVGIDAIRKMQQTKTEKPVEISQEERET